jgi:hypothetical protein
MTAKGSGSCAAITGNFPACGSVLIVNGEAVYTLTLLITPTGGVLQTVEDVFTPANNNGLRSYDSQLFGITSGTYSGNISVNSYGVIVFGSTGTSSGTSVTLTTPIPGAAACVISIYGALYYTG